MLDIITDLPWVIAGLVWVGCFILVGFAAVWVTRTFVEAKTLRAGHDVAGFAFGVTGVVYAVLLGFMVVEVNNRFHEAQQHALQEEALLVELFRDAALFLPRDKRVIRRLIRDYAEAIGRHEWKEMQKRRESQLAQQSYNALWAAYTECTITDAKQQIWYTQSIEKLNRLGEERLYRLFSMHTSVSPIMWTALILGGLATVFFMCLFTMERPIIQCIITVLVAATIAFILFLIFSLEDIYSGNIRVVPKNLTQIIIQFDSDLKELG